VTRKLRAAGDLRRDYRVAFLRYLDHGEEAALADGYELGRRALHGGIPLLDVARVHHDTVIEVLGEGSVDSVAVATRASSFLLEVLAPYEMSRREAAPPPSE
jgi:Phosphoserine phosphatase RsbU, N-terminal domain